MSRVQKRSSFLMLLLSVFVGFAQDAEPAKEGMDKPLEPVMEMEAMASVDTTKVFERVKLDGISAVVGDYVILDSDIEKTLIDIRSQGASAADVTRCSLLGKLMEDRLYAHQAVQDSILVSDDEVTATSERQIQSLLAQTGSWDKLLKFYNKEDQESFRISQIVKAPKIPEEEKQKVIDKLNKIKADVEDNGASFKIKAILYTEDKGSKSDGGFYRVTRETGFVKEFKDVAFSLKEGQISEPFETIFGFHIIFLEKVRGQELDLRHIVIAPKIPESAVESATKELESIRQDIMDGKYTFAEAARNFSDEKETKDDGGVLRNPINFDSRFELTKMDPALYNQVRNLKDEEISKPIFEANPRGGTPKLKILKISNRFDEHTADFGKDYIKIQELALTEKQFNTIREWMDEHIEDTYISVKGPDRDCTFANNWVKK